MAIDQERERLEAAVNVALEWPDLELRNLVREALAGNWKRPDRQICGIVSLSGPSMEPLACGYLLHHDGPHAWATLPTFTAMREPVAD